MKLWTLALIALTPHFLLGGMMYWADSTGPTEIIEVECYDRYSNEIVGVVCEEEVISDPLRINISRFGWFGLIFTGPWILFSFVAYDKRWNGDE